MNDAFRILAQFLDQFDLEVEGRSQDEPPQEVRSQLRQLALGELEPPERDELVRLLRDHPQWIKCLAAEIKALRPPQMPP